MSWILRLQIRHYFGWIFVFSVSSAVVISFAQTACYSTPSAAIESLRVDSSLQPSPEGGGYRVTGIRVDPLLMQRWAMVASCGHPEWPVLAVRTDASNVTASAENQTRTVSTRAVPVVVEGDIVRLWRQEDFLRIEVAGVSEESGGLGERIRVRLLPRNTEGQWTSEQFFGVVRGPSDVEMQP
jgi:hypothetical protein